MADAQAEVLELRYQTDRQRWLGRNHAPGQPQGLVERPPSDAGDAERIELTTALDPVSVLAVRVRIAAGAKARLTFATAASADAGTLHAIVDKYRQASHVQRASLMSATLAGIRLRTMRLSASNLAAIQSLTTGLLFGLARPPGFGGDPQAETGPQSSDKRLLWRLGISGDRPIVLVWATVIEGLNLLRVATQALRWWAWGGVACDLVVVNLLLGKG